MPETAKYVVETSTLLKGPFKSKATDHLVYDKKVNDNFDDIFRVVVTHDGTTGNEGAVFATLVTPLVHLTHVTKDGIMCKTQWRLGDLVIQEKQGRVMVNGNNVVDGVAQTYELPVKLEVVG